MITRFKQQIDTPYILHDMVVSKITCKKKNVCLKFRNGYVSAEEPDTQVKGKIVIEKVDMDSSCVLLLSKMGKYGKFDGRKLSLKQFVKRHGKCCFEIVDEMYGYNQIEYIGYLHFSDEDYVTQVSLSLYSEGDIVYETEE